MESIDYDKYYTITPDVAFGTPVYIHSHERTLRRVTSQDIGLSSSLSNAIQQIHGNYVDTMNALRMGRERLLAIQNKLIQAGYPTTSTGAPKGMTEELKNINREILKVRTRIMNGKRRQKSTENTSNAVSKLMKELDSQPNKTIKEFLDSQDFDVSAFLGARMAAVFNKKRYNQGKIITIEEVKNYTYDAFKQYLKINNEKRSNKIAEDLNKSIITAVDPKKEFADLIKRLEKDLPILTNLDNLEAREIEDKNLYDTLKRIGNINIGALYRMGSLGEVAAGYAGKGGSGTIEYQTSDNKTIAATNQLVGAKIGIAGGDSVTTDIKSILTSLEEVINYGISVKLNPRYFRKEIKNSDTHIYNKYDAIKDKSWATDKELQYYVLNYQALSLVRFPNKDKEMYRDAAQGIRPTPIKCGVSARIFDLIGELEKALLVDAFIRATIGSLFVSEDNENEDYISKISEAQGLPVIIQTSGGQYWTSDILQKLEQIIMNYKNDPEKVGSFIENFTPYKPYGTDSQKNKLENLLIDLYMAKAENKYNDNREILDNRYEELIADQKIVSILRQIENVNKIRYGNNLDELLGEKTWKIKFDFSKFL